MREALQFVCFCMTIPGAKGCVHAATQMLNPVSSQGCPGAFTLLLTTRLSKDGNASEGWSS